MPIYEYVCADCGEETEALRRMSQSEEPFTCPSCESRRTKKKQGRVAVGVGNGSAAESAADAEPGLGGCGPGGACGLGGCAS